jgi:hypothetical protein
MSASEDFNRIRADFMRRASAPSVLPQAFKLAYLIAFKYMNVERRFTFVAQETLAADLVVTVRHVRRLIDLLQPLGLAVAPAHGRDRATTYRIKEATEPCSEPVKGNSSSEAVKRTWASACNEPQADIQRTSSGHPAHLKRTWESALPRENQEKNQGGDSLPPDSASPRVKKTDARAKAASGKKQRGKVDVTAMGFGAFWSAYPKRVEEAAALKAFIAAVEQGVDPEVLIAGAKRYTIERAEKNPDYTKHPATWLNKGCWTDETSGPTVIDEAGNIIAFAARRDEPEPTEAEIRREWGLHSRADEMLLRERGYGRA